LTFACSKIALTFLLCPHIIPCSLSTPHKKPVSKPQTNRNKVESTRHCSGGQESETPWPPPRVGRQHSTVDGEIKTGIHPTRSGCYTCVGLTVRVQKARH
jgi:hypothetical protein